MDFSFIIKRYIIVANCKTVECWTKVSISRVRMTYVKGTAEIKKYLQALQGVHMDQGNLSVPKERKMRKLSLLVTELRTDETF